MGGRGALAAVALLSVLFVLDNNVGRSAAAKAARATVVGEGVCTDCVEQNLLKGLRVAVVCETSAGKHEAKAFSRFDGAGRFRAALPHGLLDSSGALRHSCFAQLFDPSKKAPCPTRGGLDAFKLVPHPSTARTFTTASPKLAFSRFACSSAFLWPHPIVPLHPWFKHPGAPSPAPVPCPPTANSPVIKKPNLPPIPKLPPVIKKPLPPLPQLPPVIKKPLPPVPKLPPPVIKKPLPPLPQLPPPVIKKPLPPVPKLPPPVIKKPLPPIPKLPPVIKKPLPPLPQLPPVIKKPLPPVAKLPPPVIKKPLPPVPKYPPVIKKPLPPVPKFPPVIKKPSPKQPGWPHHPKN